MKKVFSLLITACIILSCGSEKEQSPPSLTQTEIDGVDAAKAWLVLIDEGKYEQSWDEAAEIFKNALAKDQWASTVTNLMSTFGKVINRELLSAVYRTSLPGAPDGKYVLIQFKTNFEQKKNALETVTPKQVSNGKWRVSGYYIK